MSFSPIKKKEVLKALRNPLGKNRILSKTSSPMDKGKILKMGIPLIATDCPGCLFQLKSGLKEEAPSFDIVHTAVLVARSLKARENDADESAVLGSI